MSPYIRSVCYSWLPHLPPHRFCLALTLLSTSLIVSPAYGNITTVHLYPLPVTNEQWNKKWKDCENLYLWSNHWHLNYDHRLRPWCRYMNYKKQLNIKLVNWYTNTIEKVWSLLRMDCVGVTNPNGSRDKTPMTKCRRPKPQCKKAHPKPQT